VATKGFVIEAMWNKDDAEIGSFVFRFLTPNPAEYTILWFSTTAIANPGMVVCSMTCFDHGLELRFEPVGLSLRLRAGIQEEQQKNSDQASSFHR
jgi:hypothetical protein